MKLYKNQKTDIARDVNHNAKAGKALECKVCDLSLSQGGCDDYNRSTGLFFNFQRTRYLELSILLDLFPTMSHCRLNLVAIISARKFLF